MTETLQTIPIALAALALTLGLVLLVGRLGRRAGLGTAPRAGRRLAVIETIALDASRRLVIARCDGRDRLLLVGGQSDLMLGCLGLPPDPDPDPGPADPARGTG